MCLSALDLGEARNLSIKEQIIDPLFVLEQAYETIIIIVICLLLLTGDLFLCVNVKHD